MKEQAMQSYNTWKNIGKPRSGKEFDDMRFDKLKYKALVKSKEQASVHQFSDSLLIVDFSLSFFPTVFIVFISYMCVSMCMNVCQLFDK